MFWDLYVLFMKQQWSHCDEQLHWYMLYDDVDDDDDDDDDDNDDDHEDDHNHEDGDDEDDGNKKVMKIWLLTLIKDV